MRSTPLRVRVSSLAIDVNEPGPHTIRIQSEGFRTLTDRLQVDVGNPVRKRYTLIPE